MARLPDEGESHGSFRHGKLAVLVPGRGPAELPELLGDGEQQSHGHQAGGQRGQGRDQVKGVEHHPRVEVSNGSLWGGRGGRSNFVRLLCVDQLQKVSSEFLE